jgi:hypothetical protein
MLSARSSFLLRAKLVQPVASIRNLTPTTRDNSYSKKAQIPHHNMFWMKHQIEAKPGFHSHINKERVLALAALGSCVSCVLFPGNFFLDTACAITFVAHGFYGVEAMIGDYVPLIAPAVVAKILMKLWGVFCVIMTVAFVDFNLKIGDHTGVGHCLRALMGM